MSSDSLGGTYRLGDRDLPRMGYGAMRLTGPGIFGPPADRDAAIAVLRTGYDLGVRHIDTADFYGPAVTNQLIRDAFAPYPEDLVIATKVGAVRDEAGGWVHARRPTELTSQVHDNLRRLDVETLEVVNLRVGGGDDGHSPVPGSIAEQFGTLADLQRQGLIRHVGLSVVNADQLREAQAISTVACVQQSYNLADRRDEAMLARTGELGIAYVPFFPLGGFSPLQSDLLNDIAQRLEATPMQVALAWLLQRAPHILLIPGTSSLSHLRENVLAASLDLPADVVAALDQAGAAKA